MTLTVASTFLLNFCRFLKARKFVLEIIMPWICLYAMEVSW
jgi:hypothetical protein